MKAGRKSDLRLRPLRNYREWLCIAGDITDLANRLHQLAGSPSRATIDEIVRRIETGVGKYEHAAEKDWASEEF